MNITKIVFENENYNDKSLAVCSITLDDSLRLNKIRLFHKQGKGYYLVLPSKQDVFQEIQDLNKNKLINVPKTEKEYDEFFFPIESTLYQLMLCEIVSCFKKYKENGKKCFKF